MVTILTSTYNRAYILPQLFKSLLNQTCKHFEWIIIDDGSTDETNILVQNWVNNSLGLCISYFYQENGGKHRALNYGVPMAKYNYIFIVDSDDYLTQNAIELIVSWLDTIQDNNKYAGISGLRGRNESLPIGKFPKNKKFVDATNLQRKKYKLLGDKSEVYKKDILIKYPFPEFQNEKFLPEAATWDRIAADGYMLRWFDKIICICNYLSDGLTKNSGIDVNLQNFKGYTYVERLNVHLRKFPDNTLSVGRFIDLAKIKGLSNRQIKDALEISTLKLVIGYLFGFIRKIIKRITKNKE